MGQTSPLTMHLLFHQRRGGCGEESRCGDEGEGVSGGCGQKGPSRVGKASDEEVLRRKRISVTVSKERCEGVSALHLHTELFVGFSFLPSFKKCKSSG